MSCIRCCLTVTIGLIISCAALTAQAQLKELRIGFINELTGPVASLGEVCSRGVAIALDVHAPAGKVAGVPVKVLVGDARDDVKASLSEFERLAGPEGAQVIVSIRSKSAIPIGPLAEKRGLPLVGIVGSPAFTAANRLALRIFPPPDYEAAYEAGLSRRLGQQRIAIVNVEDEFAVGLAEGIQAAVEKDGRQIVYRETAAPQESNYAPIISKLKRARPDAIYAHLLTRSGLFIRQLREQGVKSQVFTWYWIQQPEQIAAAGQAALEGVIFTEVNSDKPLFQKAYHKLYPNQVYNSAAYLCYVSTAVVLEAAKRPQALTSQAALREAVVGIPNVRLLDNDIPFKNREIQFDLTSKVFRAGKPVTFPEQ